MKWEKCTLNDICDKANGHIQTGPFGSQLHQSDYSDTGTPVVMPKDIIDGRISEAQIARVEDQHVLRLSRHQVTVGDILFSRRGDVGRCAYISEKEAGWLCGTGCLRVTVDADLSDSKYVFYYLQQPSSIEWIEKHAIGATMLNLNTGVLASVPLLLPDLPTQNRIASILSAYDDLIENNRRQIQLLEEAAQRLYREWFVELRFPGHEDVKIVDGVPEGWKYGCIKELILYHDTMRKPLSSKERASFQGKYRYYGAAGILDHVAEYLYDGTYLLLGEDGSVITADGYPVLQYVSGQFWVNNHAHVLQGKPPFSTEYIYMMFQHTKVSDIVTGVAQPKISQNRLSNKKVLIPHEKYATMYCTYVRPYFQRILLLKNQIEVAQEARDRLLPKLMSGEMEEKREELFETI